MKLKFESKSVVAAFEKVPAATQKKLLVLRNTIFDTASKTTGVGNIHETLKWDTPSYLTNETQSGTTIRLDASSTTKGTYGIFVHCQSNVIKEFKEKVDKPFLFDGTRGIILNVKEEIPEEIGYFIYLALTYHLRKKKRPVKEIWNQPWC